MGLEQNTLVSILKDLRNIFSRNLTCTKVDKVTVTNSAAVKLSPPSNCILAKVQLIPTSGGTITTNAANFSECSTTVAASSTGITMSTFTIYDIKGNNNVNGFSVISLSGTNYTLNIQYYTY